MFDSQYVEARLEKGNRLKEAGHEAFGAIGNHKDTMSPKDFLNSYANVSQNKEDNAHLNETIFGRIKLVRKFGKSGFLTIESEGVKIQAFMSLNDLGEKYEIFKKMIDIGDIVSVAGFPFFTKTGELSINAIDFHVLTKSIKPLPEKFHGLEDKETRYRKRYLDMIMNPEVTSVFEKRSVIINSIRSTLINLSFSEVETPVLNPIPGGANAKPFVTYHNALDAERFLRIAPELYLKRMIVGGMKGVFEIGKNFRNEGVDHTHNPEFTSVEFYKAYADHEYLMNMIEEMVYDIWAKLNKEEVKTPQIVPFGDIEINIMNWKRISFRDSLVEIGNVPADILDSDEKIYQFLKDNDCEVKPGLHNGKLWEELFDTFVEDKLIDPTFITDYPTSISPLARRKNDDPEYTERFELFIAGREIANGFNELNDPVDQYNRFMEQVSQKEADDESMHMDHDFVEALMYGMPPTAGAGLGIDRLVMLFTNQQSIRDVIPFPAMK